MALPREIRADFDRLEGLIKIARSTPVTSSDDANSMVHEYLCIAITGRLEQNLKLIFITYANNKSQRVMGRAVSQLCWGFQNPSKEKIIELVSLFDRDFSKQLENSWKGDESHGNIISDMVGLRKSIAHQTTNSRIMTMTKIERFYKAYTEVVSQISSHFLDI